MIEPATDRFAQRAAVAFATGMAEQRERDHGTAPLASPPDPIAATTDIATAIRNLRRQAEAEGALARAIDAMA